MPLPFLNTAGCHLRSWELSVLPPALHQRPVGWQSTEKGKEKMAAGPFQPDKHLFDILPSRRQFWCISAAPPATTTVSSQRQSPSSICPSQSASTSHTKAYSHVYTLVDWPCWFAHKRWKVHIFLTVLFCVILLIFLLSIKPVLLCILTQCRCLCGGSKSLLFCVVDKDISWHCLCLSAVHCKAPNKMSLLS